MTTIDSTLADCWLNGTSDLANYFPLKVRLFPLLLFKLLAQFSGGYPKVNFSLSARGGWTLRLFNHDVNNPVAIVAQRAKIVQFFVALTPIRFVVNLERQIRSLASVATAFVKTALIKSTPHVPPMRGPEIILITHS